MSRRRLALVAIAVAVVSLVFRPLLAFQLTAFSNPEVNAELAIVTIAGLSLDASLFLIARNPRFPVAGVLNYGMVYEVLRCLVIALAMVRIDGLAGLDPPAITFALAGMLLFPLIVPMGPVKALVVSLLAAATQPLVLAVFAPAPVPPLIFLHSTISCGATVAFAVLCGRLGYSLTLRAARGLELGSYHLEELLERDETGELWRASHRLLARSAALRTVRPNLANSATAEALRMFRREARTAATLTSPHTLALYDYGVSADGAIYRATELPTGESLAQHIVRFGPLRPEQAISLAAQVCDSLAEAHAAGLVHRALTPDNVFFCHVGRSQAFVKVGDFCRVGSADLRSPSEGSLAAAFVAPEVAVGYEASERSDIYQLGCLLFVALTGHAPPQPRGPNTIQALLRGLPESLPDAAVEAIERCLAPNPAERVESARLLLATFNHLRGAVAEEESLPAPLDAVRVDAARVAAEAVESAESPPPSVAQNTATSRLLTVESRLSRDDTPEDGTEAPMGPTDFSPEVIEMARYRFSQVVAMSAGLSLALLGLREYSSYLAVGELHLATAPLALLGIALDLGMWTLARDRRLPAGAVFNAALAYFPVRCLLFTVIASQAYLQLGLAPPRIAFGAIFVVLLPALVPKNPRALLASCLVTVAAYSLGIAWVFPPEVIRWPVLATYALMALVLSMFTAHMVAAWYKGASMVRTYGAYRLTELIGEGAMGSVWRAEHELLARPAAVKLIRPLRQSPAEMAASRRRFEHEAYVTAHLTSSHTVTLYDYGATSDGTYYCVMELLEGEDLQRHVREHGPVSPAFATSIALQVCDSLAEAHFWSLVHRDLKPSNIFLCRAGCRTDFVKVLDFGLVELMQRLQRFGDPSSGARHRLAGTPQYMAPEVFLTQGVDARSDIYQLGCVLYFLLTGRPVFSHSSLMALANAHMNDPPPRVSSQSPFVIPEELDELIARCLEKRPEDRFSSAEELEAALRRVVEEVTSRSAYTMPVGAGPMHAGI